MPAVLVWLLGGLATLFQGLIPRILFSLGIGFATFSGFDAALTSLKSDLISRLQGLPGVLIQVLSLCRIDQGLSLIMSAYLAVVATRLVSGSLTRITMKGVV